MTANIWTRLQDAFVRDRVGQSHDLWTESVLHIENCAAWMVLRVVRCEDATVAEYVLGQPSLDIPAFRPLYCLVRDRAEL